MHTAILIVKTPTTQSYDLNQAATSLRAQAAQMLDQYPGIKALSDHAWIIDLNTSLPFFSIVSGMASRGGLSFEVTFLDKKPEWLSYPQTPADKA